MGKFLGYVEALPFISKAPLVGQDRLVKAQVALRKKHTPSLDLYRMLKESASRRRLILTLPWIVEFCSVQDPVAMQQLPFYKKLFTLMVKIYKRHLCIKPPDEIMLPKESPKAGFIFVRTFFCPKKENVPLFSSSLPRFDICHKTSQTFPRTEQTFASARSFGVIS